jgi:hypothetical protein
MCRTDIFPSGEIEMGQKDMRWCFYGILSGESAD